MSVPHGVARLLLEVSRTATLPDHVWAVAMQYFFAFNEFTEDACERLEELMVGVASLVLSVKASENYLNSCSSEEANRSVTARVSAVLDAAARVILAYAERGGEVSVESIIRLKRKLRELVPTLELNLMRVLGDALVIDSALATPVPDEVTEVLVEVYSSPVCLNFPPKSLLAFAVNGRNQAIRDAIASYL